GPFGGGAHLGEWVRGIEIERLRLGLARSQFQEAEEQQRAGHNHKTRFHVCDLPLLVNASSLAAEGLVIEWRFQRTPELRVASVARVQEPTRKCSELCLVMGVLQRMRGGDAGIEIARERVEIRPDGRQRISAIGRLEIGTAWIGLGRKQELE